VRWKVVTVAGEPRRLHDLLPASAARIVLDCQAAVVDQFTFARLAQAGIAASGRCLVVGAATGSVTRWLDDEVGINGQVTTIDSTEQRPSGNFDLVYSRMALADAPMPGEKLASLAELLVPGGVLVVEEWAWSGKVFASTDPNAATLYARYQHALVTMLAGQGTDLSWAERVPAAMLDVGLVGVDVAAYARSWPGGTPGIRLHVVVMTELHDRLVAAGVPSDDLTRLRDLLADPHLLLLGNPSISTVGRRDRAVGSAREGRPS
jgi:predicted O-methyltransferase YrrM